MAPVVEKRWHAYRVRIPRPGQPVESMGTDAYRQLPAYRAEADRCAQAFVAAGLPSPLPYLLGEAAQDWSQTEIQGGQFIHAVGLAAAMALPRSPSRHHHRA